MTNSTTPGYPGSNDDSLGASTTGTTGTTTSGTTTTGTATAGTAGSTYESTTPGAREEAANLANEAGAAGRRVAETAKEETKAVGYEARRQARRLADQVGSEVRQQAATQQSRAASGLRNIGDEFSNMASGSGSGSGLAADLARQAGDRVGAAAQWLDERDPRSVLEEVKGFARRRPGVFLAIAVGAGVVVGRLTRAIMQPDDSDTSGRSDAALTGRTGMYGAGSGYDSGTGYGTGVPGTGESVTTETIVTGPAVDRTADPLRDETWVEGNTTTTRGGA